MADRHPNEWIERLFVVHEALPVSQHCSQLWLAFGRRVHNGSRHVVLQLRARRLAHGHIHAFDRAANHLSGHGCNGPLFDGDVTGRQGSPIPQCLQRGAIGSLAIIGKLEELIGGGDNVLDLRACLGFQEWKRVDQHGRIWEQLGTLPELRQGRTGVDAAF